MNQVQFREDLERKEVLLSLEIMVINNFGTDDDFGLMFAIAANPELRSKLADII